MAPSKSKWFLIGSPLVVLLIARLGVEISTRLLPDWFSWLPAFGVYYLAIGLACFIATRYYKLPLTQSLSISLTPYPKFWRLFWGVIIPALLPITAFIGNVAAVPISFLIYIVVFAIINPVFEEGFWRGLLSFIPGNATFRIIYTAALFSFSHYVLWGYWFKSMWVIMPTVISTFIMGVLWMWFIHKEKNFLYPYLSHLVVDILNLSVAVYYGIVTFGHK